MSSLDHTFNTAAASTSTSTSTSTPNHSSLSSSLSSSSSSSAASSSSSSSSSSSPSHYYTGPCDCGSSYHEEYARLAAHGLLDYLGYKQIPMGSSYSFISVLDPVKGPAQLEERAKAANVDLDEIVVKGKQITIAFDSPFLHPATFSLPSPNPNGGFTRRQLLQTIVDRYQWMYAEDERTRTSPQDPNSPHFSDGCYSAQGHPIHHLVLAGVSRPYLAKPYTEYENDDYQCEPYDDDDPKVVFKLYIDT